MLDFLVRSNLRSPPKHDSTGVDQDPEGPRTCSGSADADSGMQGVTIWNHLAKCSAPALPRLREHWVSGGVREWLVQEEEAGGEPQLPQRQAQPRKDTQVLIRSRLQVLPSESLKAVSWFLDGSDLEMQTPETLPRRHGQVPQTATPWASAALCVYLLAMVPHHELFMLAVSPRDYDSAMQELANCGS